MNENNANITVDKLKSVYDYKFNDLLSFYADAKED